jgi:hypothetical protein
MKYVAFGVIVWFIVSVLLEVVGTAVFRFWLRRKGVQISSLVGGVPGVLEYAYMQWCRSQSRSAVPVLVFRGISLLNAIAASGFFIYVLTHQ